MADAMLKRRTGLKTRKGLERRTPLKAHNGLNRRKRLKPVSKKQRAINKLWGGITDERCYELGFICEWCRKAGQRNDPIRFDYLNGHHKIKRRFNIHTKKNCYVTHQTPCHGEIEDNNVDVERYPNREAWLKSKSDGKES